MISIGTKNAYYFPTNFVLISYREIVAAEETFEVVQNKPIGCVKVSKLILVRLHLLALPVDSSFERFCLTAGIGAIEQMLCEDAERLGGAPHRRGGGRVGHRVFPSPFLCALRASD